MPEPPAQRARRLAALRSRDRLEAGQEQRRIRPSRQPHADPNAEKNGPSAWVCVIDAELQTVQGVEHRQCTLCEQNADAECAQSHQHRLAHELGDELRPLRAERLAHPDLAGPLHRPGGCQVCEVDRRDEQDGERDAQQNVRVVRVVREGLLQVGERFELEVRALGFLHVPDGSDKLGHLRLQRTGLGAGLEQDVRRQKRAAPAVLQVGVVGRALDGDRDIELQRRVRRDRFEDAAHGVRRVVADLNGLADRVGLPEEPLCHLLRDDGRVPVSKRRRRIALCEREGEHVEERRVHVCNRFLEGVILMHDPVGLRPEARACLYGGERLRQARQERDPRVTRDLRARRRHALFVDLMDPIGRRVKAIVRQLVLRVEQDHEAHCDPEAEARDVDQ